MDTRKGPIADTQDFRKAMEGAIEWEDIRIYRELKQIRRNQAEWIS